MAWMEVAETPQLYINQDLQTFGLIFAQQLIAGITTLILELLKGPNKL